MGRTKDLTGQRFGRLVVIKRVEDHVMPSGEKRSKWLCECDCGNKVSVIGKNLTKKNGTKSCGCFQKENMSNIKKKYNTYDLSGEYGIGYTSKGEEFWFDKEDYNLIKDYCWYITNKGYISTYTSMKQVLFHKLVMNNQNSFIDHINHNKFDNRKCNLRIVTSSQNGMNATLSKNNTSGVAGVTWHKRDKVWQARIKINYKYIHLGYYDVFEDAVKARKEAEKKYFGEYSYDNSKGYNIN